MVKEKFQYIWSLLKTGEVRKKILYTLIVLFAFRLLASVPVVGIPADSIAKLFQGTDLGDILSTLSGGVLETASVVAIGLSPYINASVILQLLTTVIPKLEELRNEGSQGRRTISMYTRLLTLPLAILQSFVIYSTLRGFGLIQQLSPIELMAMSSTLTAGAMIMMWMGELLSEGGVGNGSSMLIFLGILAGIPGSIETNFKLMDPFQKSVFIAIYVFIIAVVVLVNESERRIKVQYSRRMRASGSRESYIPIKLTQFGVMPVIFALSLFSFPQIVAQFLISRGISDKVTDYSTRLITFLGNQYVRNIGEFVLIVLFAFFYVTVVFNTDEYAENLQKQGAFIQGIRPGANTAQYLRSVSFKLTAVGAVVLAFLAILPNLLSQAGIEQTAIISGTGFLIAVSTVLDVKRQVESMVVVRSYEKYS